MLLQVCQHHDQSQHYSLLIHCSKAPRTSLVHQILPILTALLLLQTRLTNIPTFLLFEILRLTTLSPSSSPTPSPASHTLTTLLLAHVSYFALDGTNAISSLDLSLAYNGIASYNAQMVGLLLFLGNWAGPIWFSIAGLGSVVAAGGQGEVELDSPPTDSASSTSNSSPSIKDASTVAPAAASPASSPPEPSPWPSYLTHITHLTLFLSSATLSTMLACAALRTHLFVWTVFSPKFLYAVAWLVGWHVFVNLGVGGGLVALG
jgi:ethanolaminephosphotransferase